MDIKTLTDWHRTQLARGGIDAFIHQDAINLLGFCIEVPVASPGDFAREFSFEILTEASSKLAKIESDADDEEDKQADETIRLFWKKFNREVAQ